MMSHLKEPVNLTNFKHLATIFVVVFIALAIPLTVFLTQKSEEVNKTPQAATTRDPALWPFDKSGIWNLPIGGSATFTSANFPASTGNGVNTEDEMIMIDPNSPLRQTYMRTGEWNATCSGGTDFGSFHVPDGLTTPLTSGSFLPNNTGGALKSDGRTIQEGIWIARCAGTGPLYWGYGQLGTHDIYGSGIVGGQGGGHGGSGLSAVGGSIRHWEIQNDEPIRHALKLTVPTAVLSKSTTGFKWPAVRADSGWNGSDCFSYSGSTPAAVMGALVALPPSVNVDSLATTPFGKRIGHAMQDYGVYIVDTNPCWDPFTFNVENNGDDVLRSRYGYGFGDNPLEPELFSFISRLNVVTNWNLNNYNTVKTSAGTQGAGGGTPRVAWAPDFGTAVDNPPTVSITSPANGALVNTSSVNITANATDDTGISKVEFYVDGALKSPADTTSPYSYPWSTTGLTGSHTISAKAYDTINQASSLQTITVTVDLNALPPPAPWVSADIGAVGIGGSAIYSSSTGTFTISGSGDDIWNAADAFRYVHQPLNGDGTIIAKVNSQTNTDPWAKAGVMLRETTASGSINVLLTTTTGSGLDLQYRSATNGLGTYVNGGAFTYPVWLKLQRTGNNITASKSTDGVSFTQVGTTLSLPMAASVTVGLAVTSHNNTLSSSATFSNVAVSTGGSDTTAPTVSITSPVNSASVSGAVSVTASASDNVGVSKVDFLVDGSFKGSDNTSPYTYPWDSQTVGNGSHQLTAKAFDAAGNTNTSSVVAVSVSNGDTTLPSTPTGLTATAASPTQVNLNWTASTDNVGVTGYWIIRGGVTIATSPINSFEDRTVSPSTTYSYQVIAFDAAGNISAPSDPPVSVTTPAAPDTQAPSTPTNLAATAVSSSQINLSWTAATDNIGVTNYEIWRNSIRIATIGNVTSFGDTGLAASTTYSYFVKTKDAAGNVSANSNSVSADTQFPPTTTGTITGTVNSSVGGVLSGARVSTVVSGSKRTVTTNSSGVYSFTFLPTTSYSLRYSAWRHTSQTQTVAVSAGSTTTKNVTLQKR